MSGTTLHVRPDPPRRPSDESRDQPVQGDGRAAPPGSPPAPTASTCEEASTTAPQPRRRRRRWLARSAVVLGTLLAASAWTNAALTNWEGLTQPYGHLVELPSGSVNTSVSGTGDETFVIVTGYGAPSPVLEFAPLVEDLDDHATVVVVEPFGYGWSDRRTEADRTVENISTELHQTLEALHVHRPYTLVAHSIGALYALDYVNRFPGEVRAVVSIDGSVPIDEVAEGGQSRWLRLWTASGLTRWVTKIRPDLLVQAPEDTYSEDARRRMRTLVIRNDSTAAVVEESARTAQNVEAVKGLSFPADLPVITFLAQDSMDRLPVWYPSHRAQLRGLVRSKLVVIEDTHDLHHHHSPEIADTVRAFLDGPA